MEKFAVVFAKITQNPKVWTAHLGAILYMKEISVDFNFMIAAY